MKLRHKEHAPASSATRDAAVKLSQISKRYPATQALTDVDLEVAWGESRAIIGPNGAGKSTLFGIIDGTIRPTRGEVYVEGRRIDGQAAHRVAGYGLGRAFQVPRIFPALEVAGNIMTACIAARRSDAGCLRRFLTPARAYEEAIGDLLDEVGLDAQRERLAGELAHGDKKRLELAMALASRPPILLLDEPTAGMSPDETEATLELVARIRRERELTLLLTEHDMDVVFSLADTVTVLNQGELVMTGSPPEVREHPVVREVYLGQV